MIIDNIKTKVVGVNINVEKTSLAIVDIRGNMTEVTSFLTSQYPNIGDYVTVLCNHIMKLVDKYGSSEEVRSVGISSVSGNFQTGCIENSPNLPWKGVVPLAAMLRDRMGMAVALGNNAHLMALAEKSFGAAHGLKDFVMVSLGSGMGSCIYSHGTVHVGADGFAGEIGHTCVRHKGRLCGCGNRGCLEAYTARKGVLRTAQEVMAESDEPSLMRQTEQLSPALITQYCEQGDKLAIEVYRRTGYILGLGLANYCSILNPEAIVFAGSISHAGRWLLEPAYASFEQHVFHNIQGKVDFILSNIDDDVRNILGASVLAWEVKEYSLFL